MDRREGEGGGIGDGSNFNLDTTRPVPTDLTTYPTCAVPEPIPPQTRIQPSRGGSCSCCGGSSKAKRKEEEIGDMGIEMTDIEANVWAGTRKWEYFPGKNHFYCDGRIMTAPSIKYFSLSFALILLTFGLFIAFDAPFLTQRLSIAIPIVSSILFVLVISNMLKTSCSDPGIIPRASAAEVEHMERSYGNTAGTYRPPPRTKDIIVNGQVIKSKYCFTCRMFRPPRASHCSVCDNCVERFDHHCPFLGNCVGRRNYRSFYFFVVSLSLLAIFILSFSTTHLVLLARETGDFLEALRDTPTSAVVILISFFGMWTVIGLAGFHTYLIAVEQTTNEDIKGLFGRPNSRNPYSRGSTCGNCCYILCGPLSASLLDPRGIATPEYIDAIQKPKTVQLGNPGLQTQQPARTPVPNLAASYGLTQYSYTQPTSNGVDVSHLTPRHELEQKQAVPSKKIIPATNPHLRSNGVLPHQQDQMKAGTFPEILTNVTNPGSDGVSRNRGNGNAERVKSSPNELTSVDMSMVHLQTRLKSTHRIKEDGVASTALRSSPSAASLERLTMINSPLHLDPVT